jgi:hypothetical protein
MRQKGSGRKREWKFSRQIQKDYTNRKIGTQASLAVPGLRRGEVIAIWLCDLVFMVANLFFLKNETAFFV